MDEHGNYSLGKLRVHDEQWAQDCFRGLEWEILSWRMDVEEPEAALIISIALSKKNEVAMKTGHLEIWSTLVALCKPSADGSVPFEPVRDKLIDLYGAAVDHPDFVHAFRLVIDAGGGWQRAYARHGELHFGLREPKAAQNAYGSLCDCGAISSGFPQNKKRMLDMELEANPKQRLVPVASQHLAQIVRRVENRDVRIHDVG